MEERGRSKPTRAIVCRKETWLHLKERYTSNSGRRERDKSLLQAHTHTHKKKSQSWKTGILMGYDQLEENTEFMDRYSNGEIWKRK